MRNNRPLLVAVLVAANVAALALNAAILDHYGKLHPGYAVELVRGLWKYGPVGVFQDDPIPTVYLKDVKGVRR